MDLTLTTRVEHRHTVVEAVGEVDVYTAPQLRELIIELVNAGRYDLVVDLERVEFFDSTGLGVLVGALKRLTVHNGSLGLVCTQERTLKIFRITGRTAVFAFYPSLTEALAAPSARAALV